MGVGRKLLLSHIGVGGRLLLSHIRKRPLAGNFLSTNYSAGPVRRRTTVKFQVSTSRRSGTRATQHIPRG